MTENLENDVRDTKARVGGAMALGPAHALAALLLEHADFRAARLSLDQSQDSGVRHEWRASHHFAAVFFNEQHLIQRQFRSGLPRRAVHDGDGSGSHLDLTSAG